MNSIEMKHWETLNYALSHACRFGEINTVKYLIDQGCNVNFCLDGSDPLSEAVSGNHIEVVKLLLENGATLTRSEPGCDGDFHVMSLTEDEPGYEEMHKLLSSHDKHWQPKRDIADIKKGVIELKCAIEDYRKLKARMAPFGEHFFIEERKRDLERFIDSVHENTDKINEKISRLAKCFEN